jgi:hypothetical protein
MLSHKGVFEMRKNPFWVGSVLYLSLTLAFCNRVWAQQPAADTSAANPLLRVLQAKGILTADEVAQISQASSPGDADRRLAKLLLLKGVISQADYDQTEGTPGVIDASTSGTSGPTQIAAVYRVPINSGANATPLSTVAPPSKPPSDQAGSSAPAVVPAITPIRYLPVGPLPREAGTPAFKIGSIRFTPYGFIKATVIHDSSSPNGDDFPLPGFLAPDTGPHGAPEFHLRARATRIGTNIEWLDPSPKFTITGKIEGDFEGNFSRVNNRNIGTIRSSMFSIRLAYGRIDYKFSDRNAVNFLAGQDWTPFTSSTLPYTLETTGTLIGFGVLWERAPQMRVGWTHNFGAFQLMPEFAVVYPAFGNVPANVQTGPGPLTAGNLTVGVANQLGYGERQGADSGRPEVQGRIVAQFQLDHAEGVAPAQIIFSGEQGQRTAIVLRSAVPAAAAFQAAFPNGAAVSSNTAAWTGEFQLPTRFATVIGKYYNGSDLRFYFGGQLFSNFNDTFGLTGTTTVPSVDGASNVVFGTDANGNPVFAPQRPVRTQGGFVGLGIPLSRIFHANPSGRNAGWALYFWHGQDFAKARDVRRMLAPGARGTRDKSAMYMGALYYKLNNWVTFSYEQSYFQTHALPGSTGLLPLFNGLPARIWHDLRFEGGPIFTF